MQERVLVVALAIVLASSRVASADPKVEAKQHVDRAMDLHGQGKFVQALDELKTAFALDPQPQLLYAMGQIHMALGQCTQAITYYQRFLATEPDPNNANAAVEAIQVCKTSPPPAIDGAPADRPASPPAPRPDSPAPLPPKPEAASSSRPWYGDYLADGLVGAGVVAGIAGIFEYRAAVADRDRADSAADYASYVALVDSAHGQRTTAVVLGVAGVAAIVAGGVHYALSDHGAHHGVAVIPSPGGGMVTWTGRFR